MLSLTLLYEIRNRGDLLSRLVRLLYQPTIYTFPFIIKIFYVDPTRIYSSIQLFFLQPIVFNNVSMVIDPNVAFAMSSISPSTSCRAG